jgi:hypothetical protein
MSTPASQQPCPRCQFPLAPGDVFCRQCGLPLVADTPSPGAAPPVSQPWPGSAGQMPMTSEFFAGPEVGASLTNWSAPIPPAFSGVTPLRGTPTAPLAAMPVKSRRRRKIALLALAVALVILGTGSGLAYILTRTHPVIQITSDYDMGTTLIGSASTSFHITGQQFVANVGITFLLDGKPAPGDKTAQSDANGDIQTDLLVTSQWRVGNHLLTATDSLGNVTKDGAPVQIVAQGQDGTPGPNGAPADNGSFTIDIQGTATAADGQSFPLKGTLSILNISGSDGDSTCGVSYTGRPLVYKGTLRGSNVTYTETMILACHVTYKQGHLHYVDTATSDTFVLGNGRRCAASGPFTNGAFDGAFKSSTSISGTFYRDYSRADCTGKGYIYRNSEAGTWTGVL